MMPWNNSWFQLAAFAAGVSGLILVADLAGWTPGAIKYGGDNYGNSTGNQSGSDGSSASSNPAAPAPANLSPKDAHAFTNSLGMKFVPAGTSGVLFSIWDTRVADFRAFVNATGYNATGGMYTLETNGWKQAGHTWDNPGFEQTPDSPVCGVSWTDANAFCQWLTTKEQQSGTISSKQVYRLPTDAEWSAAAGNARYPWGDDWPPSNNEANLCRRGDGYTDNNALPGADGYTCTSPVGCYLANAYGLYDMGGNLHQYCSDFYKKTMNSGDLLQAMPELNDDGGGSAYYVLRGSSWDKFGEPYTRTATRSSLSADARQSDTGFRCVLTAPASPLTTYLEIGLGLLVIGVVGYFFIGAKSKPAV